MAQVGTGCLCLFSCAKVGVECLAIGDPVVGVGVQTWTDFDHYRQTVCCLELQTNCFIIPLWDFYQDSLTV